ncbi:hypothetical protein LOTGIDRAFT_161905 [Lottia gigantea]|uniref:G-protein coupled receptors family 1 profile domain-containing protein n=1 Tax=Lottia gigantea TaxID=225164 RepID=V4AIQ4_LOTGI|nr:hypothetical protein LOTGIDRAFT_161905 [Lottia gigantea]ESO93341.1 hypothetical protein LOTGIDRAFT_161905 [Lottia gigantea]
MPIVVYDGFMEKENYSNARIINDSEISTYNIVIGIVDLIQAIFICSGNALTIIAVWKTPALRRIPNMYVVCLAVADFLSGIILFYEFLLRLTSLRLEKNVFLCLSVYVGLYITVYESVLCMFLLTFDRFLYICHPYEYARFVTARSTKISITISWILAIVYGFSPMILYADATTECTYGVIPKEFHYYGKGIAFFVPLALCLGLHSYILKTAVDQQRKLRKMLNLPLRLDMKKRRPALTPFSNYLKIMRMFLLVYCLFFICWCPWVISSILREKYHISDKVLDILALIGMCNSGFNFVIYVLLNKEIRKTIQRMLCTKPCATNNEQSPVSRNSVDPK